MKLKLIILLLPFILVSCQEEEMNVQISKQCEQLKTSFEKNFGTQLKYQVEPDTNHCMFTAIGTGETLETASSQTFADFSQNISRLLSSVKWRESKRAHLYAADGVYSTRHALEKGNLLAIITKQVTGSVAKCPRNKPSDIYTDCGLNPADRQYELIIRVSAYQK